MNIPILTFILAASFYPALSLPGGEQVKNWPPSSISTLAYRDPGLFTDEKVLDIKLTGKIRDLMNDRSETPAYHNIQLSYKDADSNEVSISLQARARGHFRKTMGNCTYPPLLLNFSEKNIPSHSLFAGQSKLKLVMPCQGDEYVIREWLLYKIYNLVTEKSFRTRLVRIELNDEQKKKKTSPFYGFLLEDEGQMAKRNQMMAVERKMLRMEQTEITTFLKMAVFQYLIANTDWSVQYQQNIKLLVSNSQGTPYTVPYDFDHAGLVNAPYALPAEELQMRSVKERRYRGFCITDMSQFKETVALFNQLKEPIYQLYTSCSFLDAKYIKSAVQYLDEFYNTINNEKKMKTEFGYPCDKNGTGNIIIQGLKKE
jgi:hypothetical protein